MYSFTICWNGKAPKEIPALLPVDEGTINILSPVSVSPSVQLWITRETFYTSMHFQIVIWKPGIDGPVQLIKNKTKQNKKAADLQKTDLNLTET